ncbi:MAG: hypothetical protein SGBAC_004843 [Bacillariaceae sp.]
MFRRLADRVFNSAEQNNVNALKNMGFSERDARNALQQTDGNLEQAANILLARGPQRVPGHEANRQQVEDDEMQRALQASMLSIPKSAPKPAPQSKRKQPKTAASSNAGKAALRRVNTPASSHSSRSTSPLSSHPNVKVPTKLADKSKEEQILRTADRLKSSPQALDTLYKTLKTLQSNPNHPKFRKIDQTTAGYQKSLATAPGAEDLLLAMNYRKSGLKELSLGIADPATLYLGISALEQTMLTPDYIRSKGLLQFHKDVNQMFHSADNSAEEAIARSEYMSKLPTEPAMGGAWIYVNFEGLEDAQFKLKRKFDGDDTLGDVLHWIAGNGTSILAKLQSGEWELVDGNRHPPACLDPASLSSRTLQYIGCWPSGKLIVRPKSSIEQQQQQKLQSQQSSDARGLGAAPILD